MVIQNNDLQLHEYAWVHIPSNPEISHHVFSTSNKTLSTLCPSKDLEVFSVNSLNPAKGQRVVEKPLHMTFFNKKTFLWGQGKR